RHFGLAATGIPVYNPFTGSTTTPLGTLPLSMKPPCTTTFPVLDWDINDILPSPPYRSPPNIPYPLSAMHEDESCIKGTIHVYVKILCNLGLADADLEAHGLLFNDGNLLMDSLVDKIESARRNSEALIDGMKVSICQFTKLLWPGSLWWEHNKLLKCKPISARWQVKKATPWKPSHELLQISLATHSAMMADFDAVAEPRHHPQNVVLLNRDALFYIEFVSAIKKGDIGRVVNVLQYADAIFETLRRIDRYDPVLKQFFLHNWLVNLTGWPYSFKEVDLLQEHQNFWAKIIYNVKGSNRSWDWLGMITVCIFTLRDTMRTKKIQEYGANRPANDPNDSTAVTPIHDLLEEGAKYADTGGAFKKFAKETRRAENLGLVNAESSVRDPKAGEDEDSGEDDDYEVTGEDLEMDDEEPYTDAAVLLAAASEIIADDV
ncbi:hypothetical protein B0H10DRAFT_2023170, partial [Mycena sp. CBHHK59/15]